MVVFSIGDVLKNPPLECHTVLRALAEEPWKIDGSIDADRCEGRASIAICW